MNYPHFWLLECAAIDPVALRQVTGSRAYLEGQWNKPTHGLNRSAVVELLLNLQANNEIHFTLNGTPAGELTEADIDTAIRMDESHAALAEYRLTPSGGEQWSSIAQPAWHRFHSWEIIDYDLYEIGATTEVTAMRALDFRVKIQHLQIDTVLATQADSPWQATYWKVLDQGCLIRFRAFEQLKSSPQPCDYTDEASDAHPAEWEFFEWYRSYPVKRNTP